MVRFAALTDCTSWTSSDLIDGHPRAGSQKTSSVLRDLVRALADNMGRDAGAREREGSGET